MGRERKRRPSLALAELLQSQLTPTQIDARQLAEVALVADRVGLAPVLWSHGLRARWWSFVPADAAELIVGRSADPFGQPELALQAAFTSNVSRIDDLLAQGAEVERSFQGAGIPCVRLKGWHTITSGWWPDPAERTMTDLDVLVPAESSTKCAEILRSLGYRDIDSGHTSFADHELAPVALPGHAGSVEIHVALLVSRWAAVLPAAEVLNGGSSMTTTDAVTHVIAHAQLQDEAYLLGRVPMRALYELALLLESPLGRDVDWSQVRARFTAVGAERALDGFLWLSSSLFAASVPSIGVRAPLRSRLALAVIDRPRCGAVVSWVAYLPRWLSADRMRSLDPNQPAWRTRLTFVARGANARVATFRRPQRASQVHGPTGTRASTSKSRL